MEDRDIEPEDYIMTNTGYNFPQYVDEDCKNMIGEYYIIIIIPFIQMEMSDIICGIMTSLHYMAKEKYKHSIFILVQAVTQNQLKSL